MPNLLPQKQTPRLNKKQLILGVILFILGIALVYVGLTKKQQGTTVKEEESYTHVQELVADKLSKNAAIVLNIPDFIQIPLAQAKDLVTFTPQIEGFFKQGETLQKLIFTPDNPLETGKYYAATVATPRGAISKDFLIEENPRVTAIFPKADSEASEYSQITIVFNRPMAPLTTLDSLQSENLPITITPQTEGTFKWISTRTLQFSPKNHLFRSTNYKIEIPSNRLISFDGVPSEGRTHTFITRPLRYSDTEPLGAISYNSPFSVRFNQPINLEETKKQITLKRLEKVYRSDESQPQGAVADTIPRDLPFIAEYGTIWHTDETTSKSTEETDKTTLNVYPTEDSKGREKLWDFNTSYRIEIAGATPEEGDIMLSESKMFTLTINDVLSSITAESPNTSYVGQNFFDPQGKLLVAFYEEIDKAKTTIRAENLKAIEYGEQCLKEDDPSSEVAECVEKGPDKTLLIITFNPTHLKAGQSIPLIFEKIVNTEGLVLNTEPITKTITLYPKLQIVQTAPPATHPYAFTDPLTTLTLCTTTPLAIPKEGESEQFITIDPPITAGIKWGASLKTEWEGDKPCNKGEFTTAITYGLAPQTEYSINLNLTDLFGQTYAKALGFTSAALRQDSRRFFQLHPRYNVTNPQKTTLTYAVENLEYVDMTICQIAPERMFSLIINQPQYTQPLTSASCGNYLKRNIDLKRQYWTKNYFKVNIADYIAKPLGHYVITFTHPEYRDYNKSQVYEYTFLTITNLAVHEKNIEWRQGSSSDPLKKALANAGAENLYWITAMDTLAPVEKADITFYAPTEFTKAGAITTDAQGIARTPVIPDLIGAIVTKGKDSALASLQEDVLEWVSSAYTDERAYIYTDRPIYRPGHTVFIKGIHRTGYDSMYEKVQQGLTNTLYVYDSKNEVAGSAGITLNSYGTFTSEFVLDTHSPLGTYRIDAFGGTAQFDVEEFVPSPFKVEITSDKKEYLAGETLELTIQGRYYFGVPVDQGEVTYSIVAQDYFFDRSPDPKFSFGEPWYYYGDYRTGDQFILYNTGTLDKNGEIKVAQKLNFETWFKENPERVQRSKIVIVYATIKNAAGQSVTTQQSFIAHRGEFYIAAQPKISFFSKGGSTEVAIKTVTPEGKEISIPSLSLEVYKISWEYFKRQEVDGGFYYRSEKKRTRTYSATLSTDTDGNGEYTITIPEEGEYELEVSGEDSRGNRVNAIRNIYVYGEGEVSIEPRNDTTLKLETATPSLEVGKSAQFIIKSPYKNAKALVALERGKIFAYEIIDVTQNLSEYTFTIEDAYIPNVYATVLLVSPEPSVKFGKLKFLVDTKNRLLDIAVTSNKKEYLPGEAVTLAIQTKDGNGKPMPAELSVAVVDASVLALKGNPKKNPLVFFYGDFPLTVRTTSNIKNILEEVDIPPGGKGGGGGEDLAKKKRGIFKETALWAGIVETNDEGAATVSFTLPDNLTNWQIETVGVTKDTKLGIDYDEITSQKQIMVIPLKPRFIIPGDEFALGAEVFNQTGRQQTLTVDFTSETLVLNEGKLETSLTLNPKESRIAYFQLKAPSGTEHGSHAFTLSAKNKEYEDTVEQTIPITRNNTYEATATAHFTTQNSAKEVVLIPTEVVRDKGELTIATSATLAVFLSEALNYLVEYPYGCSEQIASKLSSIAVLKRGLNVKNVGEKFALKDVEFEGKRYTIDEVIKIGLARMYENQEESGGFVYYSGLKPNFYLTLHVANTLKDIKDAGFNVRDDVIKRAQEFLYNSLVQTPELNKNKDTVILTAYTLSRFAYLDNKKLAELILPIAKNKRFINEQISSLALSSLALTLAQGDYPEDIKNKIFDALENRITIDARGAFIDVKSGNQIYDYYETPVKNTALFLKALAADERETPLIDDVIRWLVRSRAKDGAWGSTNNTLSVVDAFTDYLVWSKETESEFTLAILRDGKTIQESSFAPETILETHKMVIPIAEFEPAKPSLLGFAKTNLNSERNAFYYDMSLQYFLPVDAIPARDEGFVITREFYALTDKKGERPLTKTAAGEVLRGHLTITAPKERKFVAVEDFIPAGMELVNFRLATEDQTLKLAEGAAEDTELFKVNPVPSLHPDAEESHDDRLFLFHETLPAGIYEYDYYLRALIPGRYHHLPAVVSEMYFPENFGRTRGAYFEIAKP